MLKKITARNFRCFRQFEITLPDRGLLNVNGRVMDSSMATSNGAGKSSFLKAIIWGLYGHIAGESVTAVVNEIEKKNCSVTIEFTSKTGATVIVERFRADKTYKNAVKVTVNGEDCTSTDNRETQEIIDALVGADCKTFLRGCVFDRSIKLVNTGDNELKAFFEKLIGVDFGKWYSAAKTKADEIRLTQIATTSEIVAIDAQGETLQEQYEATHYEHTKWENQSKQQREQIEQTIEGIKRSLRLIQHAYDQSHTPVMQAEQAYQSQRMVYESWQSAQSKTQSLERSLAALEGQLSSLNQQIIEIPEFDAKQPCHTCGQPMPPERLNDLLEIHSARIRSLTDRRDRLVVEINEKKIALEQARSHPSVDWQTLEKYQKAYTDWKAHQGHVLAQLEMNQVQLKQYEQSLTQFTQNPYSDLLVSLSQQIETTKKRYIEQVQLRDKLTEDLTVADITTEMFSRTGLRSYILDLLLPTLNARLAYYLSVLTDNEIEAEIKATNEKGNEKIHVVAKRYGREATYESLSSGEQVRFDLALVLSIFEQTRNLFHGSIIFFDELFDHLDKVGVERAIQLLNEAAQTSLVVVISHNPYIQLQTDRTLVVVKEKHQSRIIHE